MLLTCGAKEDSWDSLRQQGDQMSQSWRKSTLNIHWKEWCWSWSSNTLATWCEEPTHWKRPWCWERLRTGGKVCDDRGWDGWQHQLNEHEFKQTPGDSEGQGSLVCCSPWGLKESDTTEQLNNNNNRENLSIEMRWWKYFWGRSQDGRGIGRGDHFLPYKFIERIERWANFTKQLLIASRGHQVPRKGAHCLQKEVGQNIKDKKRDKRARDGDLSLEGSLIRGSFQTPGNPLTGGSGGSFWISEDNLTGKKNK